MALGTEAARLFVSVGADTRDMERGLGRADQQVKGFGSNLSGLAKAAGGVYAVKQAFDATIGSAISWESAFAGVEKTVDASDAELDALEGTLRQMSRTMPVAAEELAGIAEQAGALGIEAQSIDEFTTTVAQLGETTNVSTEMAATALGQLSNVLNLTEDDFDNFGSALVDLGNKGASTEAQILEITSRAGAGAALIGIAADKTLGWSAAVANLGIEAEAGGSSLQRFFLGAAEHVGTAGDELRIMAETAKVSVGEFTDLFNNDASAALAKFVTGLGDLTQAEQLAVMEALGFNDVRIQRALLGLAGNVDNLNESLKIGVQGWRENTALQEEYGKRAKTTAARIEVLGNRLADLGRRAGESSGGPVNLFLDLTEQSIAGWEKFFLDTELMFSDQGPRMDALAKEMGLSIVDNFVGKNIKARIRDNMLEWDTSLEETLDLMERGLTPAIVATGEAWEDYTRATSSAASTTAATSSEVVAATEGMGRGIVAALSAAATQTRDALAQTPEAIASDFAEGQITVSDAAEQLAALIPAPFMQAALNALGIVEAMPGDIAQSILDGRDTVTAAANGLATAVTDPLVNQQNILQTRAAINDLATMTAEEIAEATPASEAARKAELAKLEILLAGYMLRADPKSEEAMGLLAKYAESSDPATQEAYDAMLSAVEERALVMEHNVEERAAAAGEALPDALARTRAEVEHEAYLHFLSTIPPAQQMADDITDLSSEAARATRLALRAEQAATGIAAESLASYVRNPLADLKDDAYWWGRNITDELARGLVAGSGAVGTAGGVVGAKIRGQLAIYSEPDDPASPLRGITDWGGNMVATIAEGMLGSLGSADHAAAMAAAAFGAVGNLGPDVAFGVGGGAAADTTYNFEVNLHFDGPAPKNEQEIAEVVVRAERLALGTLGGAD